MTTTNPATHTKIMTQAQIKDKESLKYECLLIYYNKYIIILQNAQFTELIKKIISWTSHHCVAKF